MLTVADAILAGALIIAFAIAVSDRSDSVEGLIDLDGLIKQLKEK